MVVPVESPKSVNNFDYIGSTFDFDFSINEGSKAVHVYLSEFSYVVENRSIILVENTDYTIDFKEDNTGGTVTLTDPTSLPSGYSYLLIIRSEPYEQPNPYPQFYKADFSEAVTDNLERQIQQTIGVVEEANQIIQDNLLGIQDPSDEGRLLEIVDAKTNTVKGSSVKETASSVDSTKTITAPSVTLGTVNVSTVGTKPVTFDLDTYDNGDGLAISNGVIKATKSGLPDPSGFDDDLGIIIEDGQWVVKLPRDDIPLAADGTEDYSIQIKNGEAVWAAIRPDVPLPNEGKAGQVLTVNATGSKYTFSDGGGGGGGGDGGNTVFSNSYLIGDKISTINPNHFLQDGKFLRFRKTGQKVIPLAGQTINLNDYPQLKELLGFKDTNLKWEKVEETPSNIIDMASVPSNYNKMIAVSNKNTFYFSNDIGLNWTEYTLTQSFNLTTCDISAIDGSFVLAGTGGKFLISKNAVDFVEYDTGVNENIVSSSFSPTSQTLVLVTNNGKIITYLNEGYQAPNVIDSTYQFSFHHVKFSNDGTRCVAVGEKGLIMSSNKDVAFLEWALDNIPDQSSDSGYQLNNLTEIYPIINVDAAGSITSKNQINIGKFNGETHYISTSDGINFSDIKASSEFDFLQAQPNDNTSFNALYDRDGSKTSLRVIQMNYGSLDRSNVLYTFSNLTAPYITTSSNQADGYNIFSVGNKAATFNKHRPLNTLEVPVENNAEIISTAIADDGSGLIVAQDFGNTTFKFNDMPIKEFSDVYDNAVIRHIYKAKDGKTYVVSTDDAVVSPTSDYSLRFAKYKLTVFSTTGSRLINVFFPNIQSLSSSLPSSYESMYFVTGNNLNGDDNNPYYHNILHNVKEENGKLFFQFINQEAIQKKKPMLAIAIFDTSSQTWITANNRVIVSQTHLSDETGLRYRPQMETGSDFGTNYFDVRHESGNRYSFYFTTDNYTEITSNKSLTNTPYLAALENIDITATPPTNSDFKDANIYQPSIKCAYNFGTTNRNWNATDPLDFDSTRVDSNSGYIWRPFSNQLRVLKKNPLDNAGIVIQISHHFGRLYRSDDSSPFEVTGLSTNPDYKPAGWIQSWGYLDPKDITSSTPVTEIGSTMNLSSITYQNEANNPTTVSGQDNADSIAGGGSGSGKMLFSCGIVDAGVVYSGSKTFVIFVLSGTLACPEDGILPDDMTKGVLPRGAVMFAEWTIQQQNLNKLPTDYKLSPSVDFLPIISPQTRPIQQIKGGDRFVENLENTQYPSTYSKNIHIIRQFDSRSFYILADQSMSCGGFSQNYGQKDNRGTDSRKKYSPAFSSFHTVDSDFHDSVALKYISKVEFDPSGDIAVQRSSNNIPMYFSHLILKGEETPTGINITEREPINSVVPIGMNEIKTLDEDIYANISNIPPHLMWLDETGLTLPHFVFEDVSDAKFSVPVFKCSYNKLIKFETDINIDVAYPEVVHFPSYYNFYNKMTYDDIINDPTLQKKFCWGGLYNYGANSELFKTRCPRVIYQLTSTLFSDYVGNDTYEAGVTNPVMKVWDNFSTRPDMKAQGMYLDSRPTTLNYSACYVSHHIDVTGRFFKDVQIDGVFSSGRDGYGYMIGALPNTESGKPFVLEIMSDFGDSVSIFIKSLERQINTFKNTCMSYISYNIPPGSFTGEYDGGVATLLLSQFVSYRLTNGADTWTIRGLLIKPYSTQGAFCLGEYYTYLFNDSAIDSGIEINKNGTLTGALFVNNTLPIFQVTTPQGTTVLIHSWYLTGKAPYAYSFGATNDPNNESQPYFGDTRTKLLLISNVLATFKGDAVDNDVPLTLPIVVIWNTKTPLDPDDPQGMESLPTGHTIRDNYSVLRNFNIVLEEDKDIDGDAPIIIPRNCDYRTAVGYMLNIGGETVAVDKTILIADYLDLKNHASGIRFYLVDMRLETIVNLFEPIELYLDTTEDMFLSSEIIDTVYDADANLSAIIVKVEAYLDYQVGSVNETTEIKPTCDQSVVLTLKVSEDGLSLTAPNFKFTRQTLDPLVEVVVAKEDFEYSVTTKNAVNKHKFVSGYDAKQPNQYLPFDSRYYNEQYSYNQLFNIDYSPRSYTALVSNMNGIYKFSTGSVMKRNRVMPITLPSEYETQNNINNSYGGVFTNYHASGHLPVNYRSGYGFSDGVHVVVKPDLDGNFNTYYYKQNGNTRGVASGKAYQFDNLGTVTKVKDNSVAGVSRFSESSNYYNIFVMFDGSIQINDNVIETINQQPANRVLNFLFFDNYKSILFIVESSGKYFLVSSFVNNYTLFVFNEIDTSEVDFEVLNTCIDVENTSLVQPTTLTLQTNKGVYECTISAVLPSVDYNFIAYNDEGDDYIVGAKETVLKKDNGAYTKLMNDLSGVVLKVVAVSPTEVFVSGEKSYKSIDGGLNFLDFDDKITATKDNIVTSNNTDDPSILLADGRLYRSEVDWDNYNLITTLVGDDIYKSMFIKNNNTIFFGGDRVVRAKSLDSDFQLINGTPTDGKECIGFAYYITEDAKTLTYFYFSDDLKTDVSYLINNDNHATHLKDLNFPSFSSTFGLNHTFLGSNFGQVRYGTDFNDIRSVGGSSGNITTLLLSPEKTPSSNPILIAGTNTGQLFSATIEYTSDAPISSFTEITLPSGVDASDTFTSSYTSFYNPNPPTTRGVSPKGNYAFIVKNVAGIGRLLLAEKSPSDSTLTNLTLKSDFAQNIHCVRIQDDPSNIWMVAGGTTTAYISYSFDGVVWEEIFVPFNLKPIRTFEVSNNIAIGVDEAGEIFNVRFYPDLGKYTVANSMYHGYENKEYLFAESDVSPIVSYWKEVEMAGVSNYSKVEFYDNKIYMFGIARDISVINSDNTVDVTPNTLEGTITALNAKNKLVGTSMGVVADFDGRVVTDLSEFNSYVQAIEVFQGKQFVSLFDGKLFIDGVEKTIDGIKPSSVILKIRTDDSVLVLLTSKSEVITSYDGDTFTILYSGADAVPLNDVVFEEGLNRICVVGNNGTIVEGLLTGTLEVKDSSTRRDIISITEFGGYLFALVRNGVMISSREQFNLGAIIETTLLESISTNGLGIGVIDDNIMAVGIGQFLENTFITSKV